MELTGFEQALSKADWVLTGEGKIDSQSLRGKLILGIAQKAREHHVPVTAFCGTLNATPVELQRLGLQGAFSILHRPCTLAEALAETSSALSLAAFNWMKTMAVRK
jgi:glycerate kinase